MKPPSPLGLHRALRVPASGGELDRPTRVVLRVDHAECSPESVEDVPGGRCFGKPALDSAEVFDGDLRALDDARRSEERPVAIIARTVKGKGVSWAAMERPAIASADDRGCGELLRGTPSDRSI